MGKYVNDFSIPVGTWWENLLLEAQEGKVPFFLGKTLYEILLSLDHLVTWNEPENTFMPQWFQNLS